MGEKTNLGRLSQYFLSVYYVFASFKFVTWDSLMKSVLVLYSSSFMQQCAWKTSGTHRSSGTYWRWLSGTLHSHLSVVTELGHTVNFSFYQEIKPWACVVHLLPWVIHYLISCSSPALLGSPIHVATSTVQVRASKHHSAWLHLL